MGKVKKETGIINAKINLQTHQLTGAGPAGKLFHKQVWRGNSNERMMTENVGSPLNGAGDQVTKHIARSMFLIAFYVLVLLLRIGFKTLGN